MSDPNLRYVTSEQLLAKAYFLSVFEKVAVPLTGFTPSILTVPLLLFFYRLWAATAAERFEFSIPRICCCHPVLPTAT